MACLLADQHVTARELPDLDAGLATAVAGKSDEVSGEPYTMPARSVRFSRTEIVMEAVTILLADDEALLLMDFEVALAHAGFHVTAVTRGGKAIEILRVANAPIDGVVTTFGLANTRMAGKWRVLPARSTLTYRSFTSAATALWTGRRKVSPTAL